MHLKPSSESKASRGSRSAVRRGLSSLCLVACGAVAQSSVAAEIELLGNGTFKPPSGDRSANIPADLPFSKADLASGAWSFAIRYENSATDSDADPYVGRYVGAVRSFRLRVGSTTIDLPVAESEIVVSDGGLGYPERESIKLQASMRTPYGPMRVSWNQVHQTDSRMDLRGMPGLLASDALPTPSLLAHLPTDRPFDRFLLLRLDSPKQSQPLLYLSSSALSVTGRPFASH